MAMRYVELVQLVQLDVEQVKQSLPKSEHFFSHFNPAVPAGQAQVGLAHVPGSDGFELITFPVHIPLLEQNGLPDGVQAFVFEFPSEQLLPLIPRQQPH